MQLVFLEASQPLTKTFALDKQGTIQKTSYPLTWEFTSHTEDPINLAQFETALKTHAAKGHCLLKGLIAHPLVKESRAGSTDGSTPTDWVCLDFDGIEGIDSIEEALAAIGIQEVSYIVQFSASSLIENKTLRAHVFMLLDKPHAPPLLKQWLIHVNHTTELFRNSMSLTKTANSIRWPLDISACQNDKLLYITPPVLKGIKDPYAGKQRVRLVRHRLDRLTIDGKFSHESNRVLTDKRLNELRDQAGLPKRKFSYKLAGSNEVLAKPDVAIITELKEERGFVYFNLNGGDSWAYYHPENAPEYIFNFKGEPTYLTKELLPEYWQELCARTVKTTTQGLTYLAFCDRATSTYWRGTYDANADHLDLHQAKNETQIRHFAKQHGLPMGDFIPEWDLIFDPKDSVRVDLANQVVNQFTPSEYMKAGVPAKQPKQLPQTIFKIIDHALGNDPDILEHFINWLAFILQHRDRAATAWVMHGVEGTGKGMLATKILRPIFGHAHTALRRMEELNEHFNTYMHNALIVVMDEMQAKALANEGAVMAKLRNFITEERVTIRAMRENGVELRNYSNWLFFSNKSDPVAIPKNDRRFNVAKYQPNKLEITNAEVDRIPLELQAFHDYLLFYPLDADRAHTIIETADRATMISISESSVDQLADAILKGDFEFLMDQLPSDRRYVEDISSRNKLDNYIHVLRELIDRTDPKTRQCKLSREELRAVFEFVCGSMPNTPNKFTSLLKHHRIHTEKVWIDRPIHGVRTTWQSVKQFNKYHDELAPKMPMAVAKIVPISAAPTPKGKQA